jgi:hypothetical protein
LEHLVLIIVVGITLRGYDKSSGFVHFVEHTRIIYAITLQVLIKALNKESPVSHLVKDVLLEPLLRTVLPVSQTLTLSE